MLSKAVARLWALVSQDQEALASSLILVPTAEAGRRLREALATRAAERGGAVSVPYVWMPDLALTWGQHREKIASGVQERVVWTSVLKQLTKGRYPNLFPALAEPVTSPWAMGAADTLISLAQLLSSGGHSMSSAAAELTEHEEAARWADLAQLEGEYQEALAKVGLEDGQAARRQGAAAPQLPPGITRVFLFAISDPPVLLRSWLRHVAEMAEVLIFVQAPVGLSEGFDEFGVPRPESWSEPTMGYHRDLPDEALYLVPRPRDQARMASGLLRQLLERSLPTAVGVCDPSLGTYLESTLAAEGVRAFDPSDKLAIQHRMVSLMRTWMLFAQSGAWRPLSAFLRLQDVHEALAAQDARAIDAGILSEQDRFRATPFLAAWDTAFTAHLPPTLEDALGLLPEADYPLLTRVLRPLHEEMLAWRGQSSEVSCESSLRRLLDWIYGWVTYHTQKDEDGEMARLLGEAVDIASVLDRTSRGLGQVLSLEDLQLLLIQELEKLTLSDTRGEVDLVLHGWLELLWESAPGLVVTGFNEEYVPGVLVAHAFLPDTLRRQLGLASQATRRARDAYILAALVEQRRRSGDVRLVLGRVDDENNALKPSRLLFSCNDQALPQRIGRLFPKSHHVEEDAEPAWEQAWPLRPLRKPASLASISVSWLNSYLDCPFRFYLRHVLKMQGVDASQRELSARDFGDLVHQVLAEFGRSPLSQTRVREQDVAAWLDERVVDLARQRWGVRPYFTVTLQVESARQRLRAVASELTRLQDEGWQVEESELKITPEWGLLLDGVPFTGRIDRLDARREPEGWVYRIWDIKTGTAEPKALGRATAEDAQDPWRCYFDGNGLRRWKDLQLFLYTWAIRERYEDAVRVEAGYLRMPAAIGKVGSSFENKVSEPLWIEDSVRVAEEAVRRIRQGHFWPPTRGVRYDDAAALWLGKDPEHIVEAGWMEGLKQ